jgi:hypothetical protein
MVSPRRPSLTVQHADFGWMTGNSDRTVATFTQSLIGGMEATGDEAETLLTKKTHPHKIYPATARPRARQSHTISDGPVLASAMLREELEQIQFLLGHVSVQTTERYLGCKQRLRSAVNDHIGIEPHP